MADSDLKQKIYKMSFDHLVVPESKEVLKKKKSIHGRDVSKGHRSQIKELNKLEQENK